jgi:hypothetical protein
LKPAELEYSLVLCNGASQQISRDLDLLNVYVCSSCSESARSFIADNHPSKMWIATAGVKSCLRPLRLLLTEHVVCAIMRLACASGGGNSNLGRVINCL